MIYGREIQPFGTLFNLSSPQGLLSTLPELCQTVESEGQVTFNQWRSHIQRPEFLSSALNLAEYLALRRHDLYSLPKGVKLRPKKGLNFPNIVLPLSPLTEKDLSDLDFVATYADVICYSFVQRLADIELLQQELPSRGEVTDAAMAKRAECVMLNKGSFIAEVIAILDDVLTRMEAHQLKLSHTSRFVGSV